MQIFLKTFTKFRHDCHFSILSDKWLLFQISKALAGTDKKELMRKLPKFIYDEDKALEVHIIILVLTFMANESCYNKTILSPY